MRLLKRNSDDKFFLDTDHKIDVCDNCKGEISGIFYFCNVYKKVLCSICAKKSSPSVCEFGYIRSQDIDEGHIHYCIQYVNTIINKK